MANQVIHVTLVTSVLALLISSVQLSMVVIEPHELIGQLSCGTKDHGIQMGKTLLEQCDPFNVVLNNTADVTGPEVIVSLVYNRFDGPPIILSNADGMSDKTYSVLRRSAPADHSLKNFFGGLMLPGSTNCLTRSGSLELWIKKMDGTSETVADSRKLLLAHCQDSGNSMISITPTPDLTANTPSVTLVCDPNSNKFSLDVSTILDSVTVTVVGGELKPRQAGQPPMFVYAIGESHQFEYNHTCMDNNKGAEIGVLADIVGVETFAAQVTETSPMTLTITNPIELGRPHCGEVQLLVSLDPLHTMLDSDDRCDNSVLIPINIDCSAILDTNPECIEDFKEVSIIMNPLTQGNEALAVIESGTNINLMGMKNDKEWEIMHGGLDSFSSKGYARMQLLTKFFEKQSDICTKVETDDVALELLAANIKNHGDVDQACADAMIFLKGYVDENSMQPTYGTFPMTQVEDVKAKCAANVRIIGILESWEAMYSTMTNPDPQGSMYPTLEQLATSYGSFVSNGDCPESASVYRQSMFMNGTMHEMMMFGKLVESLAMHREQTDMGSESPCEQGGLKDTNICAARAVIHYMMKHGITMSKDLRREQEKLIRYHNPIDAIWSMMQMMPNNGEVMPPKPNCSGNLPDLMAPDIHHPAYVRVNEEKGTIEVGFRNPFIDQANSKYICWKSVAMLGCPACSGYYRKDNDDNYPYDSSAETPMNGPVRKKRDAKATGSNHWESFQESLESAFGRGRHNVNEQKKRSADVEMHTMKKDARAAQSQKLRYKREGQFDNLNENIDNMKQMIGGFMRD